MSVTQADNVANPCLVGVNVKAQMEGGQRAKQQNSEF